MKMRALITLAVVLSLLWLLIPTTRILAQNSTCTTRCETRFAACDAAAEAALEECLDRAENSRQKVLCAVAFSVREDKCRQVEATCVGNCAD